MKGGVIYMDKEPINNTISFDEAIQNQNLQMLKAAIPYINNNSQKSMAFLVKFMELQRTVSLFKDSENSLQMCAAPETEEPRPLQMLSDIREYCSEKDQETIDMFINFVQMFSTYETLFV